MLFQNLDTQITSRADFDNWQEQRLSNNKNIITYEHLATVSVNLKYLIESGVLSPAYKWTWIASLYDLMIFADLIESETDFKDYIHNRLGLYERNDIEFQTRSIYVGYFLRPYFFKTEKDNEKVMILSYNRHIETYYTRFWCRNARCN